jgi:DNA-binding CsgD family transcriptional regulator
MTQEEFFTTDLNILSDYINGMNVLDISKKYNIGESKIRLLASKYNVKRQRQSTQSRNSWTQTEITFLYDFAKNHSIDELVLILNRPYVSIQNKLNKLNIKSKYTQNKDLYEQDILNLFNDGLSWTQIAKKLNVNINTVYHIKRKHNLIFIHKRKKWNQSENYKLINLYKTHTVKECALILKRTEESVKTQIRNLRRTKTINKIVDVTKCVSGGKQAWTFDEDTKLIELYLTHTRRQCAEILNRTIKSIDKRLEKLKKNDTE